MFAIENELGRFEADCERDAKKLFNKAKREAAKKREVEFANREIAKTRAKATAFDLLSRVITGEACPSGWRFYPHGDKYAAKCRKERNITGSHAVSFVRVETPHGVAEIEDWYVDYLGSVMNGNAHDVLVFVRNGETVEAYSIGYCDGVHAMVFVEGMTIEYFSKKAVQPCQ